MAASGFAGLAYQIVWTQQATIWLGQETAAVLAVIAAFFGGLASGAILLAPRIDRSQRPARWYAACEAVIALWSVSLALLMPPVTQWLLDLIGARPSPAWHTFVAFSGTFVLLLPATAAMGATLPAMERALAGLSPGASSIPALYAANTLGAVLGVLAAAFWMVPEMGLLRTAAVCALLNVVCAAGALKLVQGAGDASSAAGAPTPAAVLLLLAATGLLGIGYEVLVVRVLSEVAENTVFTYAMLLAVYLTFTALGAAAFHRWLRGRDSGGPLRDRLLRLLAAACLIGTVSLWFAPSLKAAAMRILGTGMESALLAEGVVAIAAFALPTFVMGMVFSELTTRARAAGVSFGRALGVNTLGAAAAPGLFGVMLLPALGPKLALLLVTIGYLALSLRTDRTGGSLWAPAAAAMALGLWAPALQVVDVPPGGRIVSYKDGVTAAVSVVEDANGIARLRINNRAQEGSSDTWYSDARQAMLPLLLHPSARHALFLGLGTSVTAFYAATDPVLEVDAVELLPEVVEASSYFRRNSHDEGANARLHLLVADARRYVRATNERFDVIVSDNFHPARSGSAFLYTVEHFEAVRNRLAPRGVFCQWLPLHQLDLATLRSIVRSFIAVYPRGWAMLATNSLDTPVVGLVSRSDAERFTLAQIRARLDSVATPRKPAELGIADEFALLGSFVAGADSLARFAGGAPVNTDDHPIVAYRAPRLTYAPDSQPRDRLIALLHELNITPDELLTGADEESSTRLSAYWRARNRFVEVGSTVKATGDVKRMLSQVQRPLLGVLQISPDFAPAYDPLLRMANALGRTDIVAARALLTELQQAQPARPEAARALRDFSGAAP